MNRRVASALLLPLLAVPLGCSSSDHTTSAGDPGSTSGSSSPMLTSMAAAGTPLGAGERAWVAFSDRGVSQSTWWAHLKPLLSESARAVYVYDDPRNLPSMTLTGKVHLAAKPPDRPHYTAEVLVPTDKGVFALDLERHSLKSKWLLYAINFPKGIK